MGTCYSDQSIANCNKEIVIWVWGEHRHITSVTITAMKTMLSTPIAAVVPAKMFVLQSCWLPSPGVMLGLEVGSTVCRRMTPFVTVGSMLLVG